jgi:hypothetical protein
MARKSVGRAAVSEEEFMEWDRSGKLKKSEKNIAAPVETPTFDDQLFYKDLDMTDVGMISGGQREVRKCKEGVRHIGFNVAFIKKSDDKVVAGWMTEGDYLKFRRNVFVSGNANTDMLEF